VAVVALTGAGSGPLKLAWAIALRFHAGPLLVAVDGGLAACRALRRRPELFVGDLDSSTGVPASIPSRIYPVAKDFSDLAGALGELLRLRADVVVLAGALGGRLDHEWANLAEVGAHASGFAGFIAPSSRGLIVVTASGVRARTRSGELVSLFALGAAARVTLRGARYTLSRRTLKPGSLGLSNVTGKELALDVHSGVAALVFPK
jgi:thiamine pyrophosphokinase